MAKTIKPDELAAAIAAELESYRQEVTDGLKKEVMQVGKRTAKRVRDTAPRSKKQNGGEYAKSWKCKKVYENSEDIRVEIHNEKHYRRAHLLEDGHRVVDRNQKEHGRAKAQPHIGPAAEQAEQELMKKVKVLVRGGNS